MSHYWGVVEEKGKRKSELLWTLSTINISKMLIWIFQVDGLVFLQFSAYTNEEHILHEP